jgi:hypothetical protein
MHESIRTTIISVGYEITASDPKTARGARTIDLDPRTVQVLRDHSAAKSPVGERSARDIGITISCSVVRMDHPITLISLPRPSIGGSPQPRSPEFGSTISATRTQRCS